MAKNKAAQALRAIPSDKRSEQSRINGRKGGRPATIFLAKHLGEGHTKEMRQREVHDIIVEALGQHDECVWLTLKEIDKLAHENIVALKSGVSPDISFGDYEFTIKR